MFKMVALLAIMLGAVGNGAAQSVATVPVGSAPFSITISLQSNTIKSGADIVLDFVLDNTSTHVVVLAGCSQEEWDQYSSADVRDESGNPARAINCGRFPMHCPPDPRLDTTSSGILGDARCDSHLTLKPHEVLRKKMILNELFDLSLPGKYTIQMERVNYPRTFIRVPKGRYGGYDDIELDDKMGFASRATVKSNVATLVVTP